MIEDVGPSRVYDLLIDMRHRSGFPDGFELADLYLVDPSDVLINGVSAIGKAGEDGLVRFRDQVVDGERYDAVILRRVTAEPPAKEIRAAGRRFARNVKALRQAAE